MSFLKRLTPFVSWVLWTLATWCAFGYLLGILSEGMNDAPWHLWLVLTLPAVAAACLWRALRAGAQLGRWSRVIFWVGMTAGFALLSLLCQTPVLLPVGPTPTLSASYPHSLLIVSATLSLLVLMLAGIRESRSGNFKWLKLGWTIEILGGALCFAILLVSAYIIRVKVPSERLQQMAMQRWAEIGRPMPEFEKSLTPVAENESLRELTQDLKPFGVATFYRTNSGVGTARITSSNSIESRNEIIDTLWETGTVEGDAVTVTAQASATLDARANDLNRLYAGILRRDPPVWYTNPADGYNLAAPNWLAARILSQWIVVDTYHRLQRGDQKGASDAIAAGLRMTQNFGEQPLLVSNMIRAAIESLFAGSIARLPEDPEAMQQLATEVETKRRVFLRTAQCEAWAKLQLIKEVRLQQYSLAQSFAHPLSTLVRELWLMDNSMDEVAAAEQIRILGQPGILADSDLGVRGMVEARDRLSFTHSPDLARAWQCLNGTFLLREQAELIRSARAQMQAGKAGNLGEHRSVVVPGSKWEITGNAAANSITLKLTPCPHWATDISVFGSQYFLVPLDGSKSWQLASRPQLANRF